VISVFAVEEHHDNGYFLPGDINEFYWGTAAFVVLLGLFFWKGWPLLIGAMRGRTERISSEIDAAAEQKVAAQAELAEVRSGLGNADAEAAKIQAEAVEHSKSLVAELRERAASDVAESRRRGDIELEGMRLQAMADLRTEVAARASNAAEAVVVSSLDDEAQRRIIDRYIDQVGASR
jgi:F-type H+-transporting ATPase subunit b